MKNDREDRISRLKRENDIVDAVGQYVRLQESNGSLKGICPFHDEKTPSFIVNPDKQNATCYGCGWHGDVLDFVGSVEGKNAAETIEFLDGEGKPSGHEVSKAPARKAPVKKKPLDLNWLYNSQCSFNNDKVKKYFRSRSINITDELIQEIGIKYNEFDGRFMLVVPAYSVAGDIVNLTRIFIDDECKKAGKKEMLGVTELDRCTLLKRDPDRLAIFEGLEDGLTYYYEADNRDSVLITYGKSGFGRIQGFTDRFKSCGAFLDPDANEWALKASVNLPESIRCLLPGMDGVDANKAHIEGNFQEWYKSCQVVERPTEEELKAALPPNNIRILEARAFKGSHKEPIKQIEILDIEPQIIDDFEPVEYIDSPFSPDFVPPIVHEDSVIVPDDSVHKEIVPVREGIPLLSDTTLDDWPDMRTVKKVDVPVSTVENLMHLLKKLGIVARYNVISKSYELVDDFNFYGALEGGNNAAINDIISQCCRYGLPKGDVPGYIQSISYKNQYNPVKEWITSEKYRGDDDYIDLMCQTVTARSHYNADFKNVLIKKWLISAVAMACNDGAKHWSKGALTFQGSQDVGKTSWFWKLFPPEHHDWGIEALKLQPGNKDSETKAARHWIAELGELDATFKMSDIAAIKGYLTSRKDTIRLPYDRKESIFPRRTAFFASVNPDEFLHDETGNTRFWVIPVVHLDFKHDIDIQQMWAQAYELYKSGEQWFLDPEEAKQLNKYNESYVEVHPIEEMILRGMGGYSPEWMTATDMLLRLGYEKSGHKDRLICGAAMKKYFGESVAKRKGRCYYVVSDPKSMKD